MQKRQSISQQSAGEIKLKLQNFAKQASQSIPKSSNDPVKWFIENVIKNNISKVPRISLLKQALSCLRRYLPDKKLINCLFLEQNNINEILFQAEHLVDMAFVLHQHLDLKVMNKKIQYASTIVETIDNKLIYMFQKQKGKLTNLLRVNHVFSFIDFKQANPKDIYDRISPFQIKELQQEIFILFIYLIKPWFQKRTPTKYYQELTIIVYWNVIMDDNTSVKQQMLLALNDKIGAYICSRKRSDGVFNYFKIFSFILDILAVNYRKQDPFRIYGLAPLMNIFENQIQTQQINNWLQNKGKQLKPQEIENIFRNSYHGGSSIFLFNLIKKFSDTLKQKKEYNILYHLYLSYIKKQFLDIVLPNATFLNNYFDILELYVIGFINRDRLEGQSQLDKLTNNLSSLMLRKTFTYKKHYERVIMFYKIYQARFSYLSSVSKKFVSDLQRLYKYSPELLDVHNKIHRNVFRDAGFEDDQNQGFQQLNIKRTDRYRGLMNLGNTCYMNSLMQALFMTKKFRSTILDIRDEQSLPSSKTLFYALINLFTEMSTKSIGTDSQIIPQMFKIETPQPFKSSWQQHDVGQFGRMYFQALTNQLDDDKNKERIQKIFFNKIRKSLICTKCKHQKQNIQQIFDFILHLNKKDDSINVSQSLGEYFQGEQMTNENQVFCERCNKKTNAIAVPHPIRLAQFLIITIGLFQYSGGGKKIKKPFNFQFTINFSRILPTENVQDQNYELYAFIVHIGNQAQRGHYICYARNLQENPTIWYCFDDGYVTQREISSVSDFQFGESETPYLLFYSTTKKRKSIQHMNSLKFSSQIFKK